MALLKVDKVTSLPVTPVPDTIYALKNGVGFDWYISNNVGVLVPMNAPAAGAPSTSMGAWNLPDLDRNLFPSAVWIPSGNSANAPASVGFQAFTAINAGVARNIATTSAGTRVKRISYLTASATAGLMAGIRHAFAQSTLGAGTTGGFIFTNIFGSGDAATVAGARQFCGFTTSTAAPTNVEPSTLLNVIGVGHGAADTNLKIYASGSAAQPAIDLGVNFPINTLGGAEMYRLTIYAPKDPVATSYKLAWHVQRIGTAFSASGTLNGVAATTLPSSTTLLAITNWRTNNATALQAILDISSITLQDLS
jgi:hypothetical protein